MNDLTTLHQTKESTPPISESLQNVLSNTYGLYFATHNYHWNVEGSQFINLHKLFDEQYNELFQAVDIIAERIRALESYAIPFKDKDILNILKTTSDAINKETDVNTRALRMVHNLIDMNQTVINICQLTKNEAQAVEDDETESLMVERVTAHQKALWILRSIVK